MTIEFNSSVQCYIKNNCFTFLSGRQALHKGHIFAAGTFSLTLVPVVCITNVLLLSHLRKKQHVPRNFHRLLQILCVADMFVGALALPSFAFTLLSYPSSCHCRIELMAQFMGAMFAGTSGRTTVAIAFHQSMHIKKLAINPFMHTQQYRMIIYSFGFCVSLITAMAVTIATFYGVYQQVAGAFTVLDIAFIVAIVFIYASAYHSVHKHVATNEIRKSRKVNYEQMFAKKITRTITILMICYGPFVGTNLVESFFVESSPNGWLKLANIWSYNIVYSNSFLNALVFLCNDGVFQKVTGQNENAVVLKVNPPNSQLPPACSHNNIALQRLDVSGLNFGAFNNGSANVSRSGIGNLN